MFKYKIQIEQRERVSNRQEALITFYAIVAALTLTGIFISLNGVNPFIAFWQIIRTTIGSPYGLSETIVKSIPLIFTGLAVAVALNSKLWNIGAEGQLYFGALFATWFILKCPALPRTIQIPVLLLFGFLGGAFWAMIPAILKLKFKMNEVISTLLLNYVAINIVDYFVFGSWKGKDNFPYTEQFSMNSRLWQLGFGRVHAGVIIALLLVVIIYFLMKYTKWGYKVKITGSSLKAAKYAGININKTMFTVFLLSGGIAGLAGVSEITGMQFKLHHAISSEYGYTGIIVAWLARSNPFVIVGFAFFISILLIGAEMLQITMGLPAAVGTIMQSLILFSILGSELFKNYKIKIRKGE